MSLPRKSHYPLLDASEPLRMRAPAVDENGKALADFMMILPGLNRKPEAAISKVTKDIQLVLSRYNHSVVFAEVKVEINLLWVSLKPEFRKSFEIASAVRVAVPNAKLVSHL
ncbi:MAG: hypothetical protein V3V12_04285 [Gammaproteobacteria bacterium]